MCSETRLHEHLSGSGSIKSPPNYWIRGIVGPMAGLPLRGLEQMFSGCSAHGICSVVMSQKAAVFVLSSENKSVRSQYRLMQPGFWNGAATVLNSPEQVTIGGPPVWRSGSGQQLLTCKQGVTEELISQAKVILRPTISQPVSSGVKPPSVPATKFSLNSFENMFRHLQFSYCGAPSLTRGRISNSLVRLLLRLASAVTLRFKFRRIYLTLPY
jgi:hypothetical protein